MRDVGRRHKGEPAGLTNDLIIRLHDQLHADIKTLMQQQHDDLNMRLSAWAARQQQVEERMQISMEKVLSRARTVSKGTTEWNSTRPISCDSNQIHNLQHGLQHEGRSSTTSAFNTLAPPAGAQSETMQRVGDASELSVEMSAATQWKRTEMSDFTTAEETKKVAAVKRHYFFSRVRAVSNFSDHASRTVTSQFSSRATHAASGIINSVAFDLVFALVILANAGFMGAQAHYSISHPLDTDPPMFLVAQAVFCSLFAVEILLRILANGGRWFRSHNCFWNYFDMVVVAVMVVETALLAGMFPESMGSAEPLHGFSVARVVRLVRVLRLVRIIRILRFFRGLRILIRSIFSTLKSLVWAMILLCLILYVFGITFAQAVANFNGDVGHDLHLVPPDLVERYGTLPDSILTLFMSVCGGISWGEALLPLACLHWWYTGVFLLYISFTHFAVLNVVTGVFCQNAIESVQRDQDEMLVQKKAAKDYYRARLIELFNNLDSFKLGTITLGDFEERLRDDRVKAYFEMMEIDVDDVWNFFKLIDTEGLNAISVDDFLEGCMRVQGNARSIDLAQLMYENRFLMRRIQRFVAYTQEQFAKSKVRQHCLMRRLFKVYALLKTSHHDEAYLLDLTEDGDDANEDASQASENGGRTGRVQESWTDI